MQKLFGTTCAAIFLCNFILFCRGNNVALVQNSKGASFDKFVSIRMAESSFHRRRKRFPLSTYRLISENQNEILRKLQVLSNSLMISWTIPEHQPCKPWKRLLAALIWLPNRLLIVRHRIDNHSNAFRSHFPFEIELQTVDRIKSKSFVHQSVCIMGLQRKCSLYMCAGLRLCVCVYVCVYIRVSKSIGLNAQAAAQIFTSAQNQTGIKWDEEQGKN